MNRKLRTPSIESCPKCKSDLNIRPKLLMLEKYSAAEIFNSVSKHHRSVHIPQTDLVVGSCNPQVLLSPPLEQFVTGFYCDRCGIGYIPDSYLKPDSYWARVARENKQKRYFTDRS
jgi:hypothetical protein